MVEGVAYENTYKDIGLTLVDMEPEVIAFHGLSWHSGESWRTVDMLYMYDERMATFDTLENKGPLPPIEPFKLKSAQCNERHLA